MAVPFINVDEAVYAIGEVTVLKHRIFANRALDRTASKALASGGHERMFPTPRVWPHHQAVGRRERWAEQEERLCGHS